MKLAHASRDCKQAATGIANIGKQSDDAKGQLDKTNAQLQELQASLENIGAHDHWLFCHLAPDALFMYQP